MQVAPSRNVCVAMDGSNLVPIGTAAAMLGVTPKTIYTWIEWGWLEKRSAVDPVSRKRRTVFDKAAVEALAAERAAGILREAPRPAPKSPPS